jgi:pimeloyl-ACP methyl ester carboxylesterase
VRLLFFAPEANLLPIFVLMKFLLISFAVLSFQTLAQTPRTAAYLTTEDGVQIAYDVYEGNATTAVVLVHGWSCDRTYWSGQTGLLAKKYKVVTIDLAGHGGSGLNRKVYSMESFGADVAAVVDKLGLQKVILIGHSMGGDVIAEAARRMPGKVAALIMVDTYKKLGAGRSPEEVEGIVSHYRSHFRDSAKVLVRSMFLKTSDPKLVEMVADDMSSAPPRVALSAMEHALGYSRQMPATLTELKLRTIAINPDDTPTDKASMKKYGVEVVIVPGLGHFLMMEDEKKFNVTLSGVLAGVK